MSIKKKYNLCVIDDAIVSCWKNEIGAYDGVLCPAFVEMVLRRKRLQDTAVQTLFTALGAENYLAVSACPNPEFFIRSDFVPDIIIFDWDFGFPPSVSVDSLLLEILETRYCFVYIFSGSDKKDEIESKINEDKFKVYRNRISIFYKDASSAVDGIKNQIKLLERDSFSFKFGMDIRKESHQAVEEILVELAKIKLEEALAILANNKDKITVKELVEFIGERFKDLLRDKEFSFADAKVDCEKGGKSEEQGKLAISENEEQCILNDFWKIRLYCRSKDGDNIIRKGDIIKCGEEYWLILTPDCQLNRFWNKTLGYLNYIPLVDIQQEKDDLKTRGVRMGSTTSITSMSNPPNGIKGAPLCFPFIDGRTFFMFPKRISSIEVPLKGDNNRGRPLKISDLEKSKKVVSLSEPFLTAVIEHVFSTLKGYGCPDYSDVLQRGLAKNVKDVLG